MQILNHVVAWKDGLFDFDNDDLPSVIRELSRWYDIDVNYSGRYTCRALQRRHTQAGKYIRGIEDAEALGE